jgi:Protein of unknown function (DUF4058)
MAVHDWTRVDTGDFHDFHQGWVVALRIALNKGILPPDYYAQVERVAGESTPDILALQLDGGQVADDEAVPGGPAVLTAPPQVQITTEFEQQVYISKKNRVVIRHKSKRRIVAMVELVSWGNKSSAAHYRRFLNKVVSALDQGIHLLLIDLFPPTRRDPQWLHGAVSAEIGDESYVAPPSKPLTLAAYVADLPCRAYVEPVSVGEVLRPMPIYLTDDHYVLAPLEQTYQAAFEGLPPHIQEQLIAAKS